MLNYKKLNVVIAFVVTFLSVCYANAQTSNSLSQGFRGIPWETKNSAFKNDNFERSEGNFNVDEKLIPLESMLKTDYYTLKNVLIDDLSLVYIKITPDLFVGFPQEFYDRNINVFAYTKKDDNLSLGNNIKLEDIYYIVYNNKFIGIIMDVDKDRSASEWSNNLKNMFSNNEFRPLYDVNNPEKYFTQIDRNTKLGFGNDFIMITHAPDDIQDIIDQKILEKQNEEQRRNEATGGTF